MVSWHLHHVDLGREFHKQVIRGANSIIRCEPILSKNHVIRKGRLDDVEIKEHGYLFWLLTDSDRQCDYLFRLDLYLRESLQDHMVGVVPYLSRVSQSNSSRGC